MYLKLFVTLIFILLCLVYIRGLSYGYYIALLVSILSLLFSIVRIINGYNRGQLFTGSHFSYEVTKLKLGLSVVSSLIFIILSVAILSYYGIYSFYITLFWCIFFLTLLWVISTVLMYNEFKSYNNFNPGQYGDNVIMTNGNPTTGNNVISGNNAMSGNSVTSEYGNSIMSGYGNSAMSGYGNSTASGYGNNTTSGFTPTGYQTNSGYQPNVANGHQNDPAVSNSYVINSVNSSGQNEYYVIR